MLPDAVGDTTVVLYDEITGQLYKSEHTVMLNAVSGTEADSSDAGYLASGSTFLLNFKTNIANDLSITGVMNNVTLAPGTYNLLDAAWFATNGFDISGIGIFEGRGIAFDGGGGQINQTFHLSPTGGLQLIVSTTPAGNELVNFRIAL